MLIPSKNQVLNMALTSLSRRVNANSQPFGLEWQVADKLIKKGEC